MAIGWADLANLLGTGLSAYGGYSQYQNSGDMQDAQMRALAGARTELGGFTGATNINGFPQAVSAPGGAGFQLNFGPDAQRLIGNTGQYQTNLSQQLGTGFDANSLGLSGPLGLDAIFGRNVQAGNQAYNNMLQLQNQGFQRPLQNTAFMGAGQQLQDAMMGGEAARMRTLDLLRQQAQPFETRAFDDLQNRQFGMGQLGSSGGALQTEAFARGLGQADLQRQLDASQEGRNFQNNALGLATGATNIGMGLNSQEQQMLQNAFGQFSQLQGMNADLNNARFQRSAFAPSQIDAMRLGNLNSAVGIQSGVQQQGLDMFQNGLAAAQAGVNARLGSAQVAGNIVGGQNFGLGGAQQANTLSQLGGALLGGKSLPDVLGSLFGGGSSAGSSGGILSNLFGGGGGAAASGAGLAGLVGGSQAGIASGIAGTTAANSAALSGMAAPTLALGGEAAAGGSLAAGAGGAGAAGGGAALGGGASADAAGMGAAGVSGAGLAAGLGIAALPLAIYAMGGFADGRTERTALALQQSGVQQMSLQGGQRVLRLPDGSYTPHTQATLDGMRERWGVLPTDQFYSWLSSLPKVQGTPNMLIGRQMPRDRRQVA